MKIYQIAPDYSNFKFLTLTDEGNSSKRAASFQGQPLIENWVPLEARLFHGKTKAEKARREDFEISCYDPRVLLLREKSAEYFRDRFSNIVEVLPVDSDIGQFFFLNVIDVVDALDTKGMTEEDKMTMLRNNKLRFKKEKIGVREIFRDATIGEVFVTEEFIKEMNNSSMIAGAVFEESGVAT
jgi:hypothetical protein